MILHLLTSCFLFFISFSTVAASSESCSTAACRGGDQIIRFPFRIQTQPEFCGYPGFDLTCDSGNQTVINLPSGKFSVQQINYQTQEIWMNDPENCLPGKILSLNLSGSPFAGKFREDFTFFNCSKSNYLAYGLNPIGCLSDSNYTVFASSSSMTIRLLSSRCNVMKIVAVPWSDDEAAPSSELRKDLRLSWEKPGCGKCEAVGGRCGFRSNSSHAILCTNIPRSGIPKFVRYAVSVGVGVPAVLCFIGILCCLCAKLRPNSGRPNSFIWVESSRSITGMGLDGPTIDSYPKIILGQSLRLPWPNDKTCPICLSEYRPKEILKSIPECQHYFHQQCIDEWLRLNASCPVCRNSPIKSAQ